jgi:hypothetical protein
MQRTHGVSNFTGETLAWFRQGEAIETDARRSALIRRQRQRAARRVMVELGLFAVLVGVLCLIVSQQLGLTLDVPWDVSFPFRLEVPAEWLPG